MPNLPDNPKERPLFKVIAHSFFVVPFFIAAGCAVLFAAMHLLTRENRDAQDYLRDVRTGGLTKRWQGAFELSKILANPKSLPENSRFYAELISAFDAARHDDPRVRQYLALALGRTGHAEFATPLLEALPAAEDQELEALIYALGMLRQSRAATPLAALLDHPRARVRSITAAALGTIASPDSLPVLRQALGDVEPNVQWGAAIALARMGDNRGALVLAKLLDRDYLSQFPALDRQEQNDLMAAAIEAAGTLKNPDLISEIERLARSDPDMGTRSRALTAVKKNYE
jgi:HEAT repeat protein